MLEAAAQWHECIRIQLVKRLGKCAADGLVLATHIRWFLDGFIEGCFAK